MLSVVSRGSSHDDTTLKHLALCNSIATLFNATSCNGIVSIDNVIVSTENAIALTDNVIVWTDNAIVSTDNGIASTVAS
ncbi:hypothetical protein [Nostoc sp.]|uniref:hypothetical protein n=1 Tax=Nostoc sp. TaxID=1180 RepID=UPI002FF71C81